MSTNPGTLLSRARWDKHGKRLTPKQSKREIARLIDAGWTEARVAAEMHVTQSTVNRWRNALLGAPPKLKELC
jgi:DNA-binding NarL/FixJ family response regulator